MSKFKKTRVSCGVEGQSRRDVLRGLGFSAGGLLVLGSPLKALAALATKATMGGGGFALLELDGSTTFLSAVEGGNAVAEVVLEQGPELLPDKRAGSVEYEDIALKLPLNVSPALLAWINSTLVKGPSAKSGAIIYADFNNIEWKRLEFSNAVISEVGVPSLEASSKNSTPMTLRLAPAATRWTGGSGKPVANAGPKATRIGGDFRLVIPGLEAAAPFIRKIEGLSAKRIAPGSVGTSVRSKWLGSGGLDMQNIKLYVSEANAVPFYSWFDGAVIKGGGRAPDAERTGRLELLTPTLATVVASVELKGLGIVRYAPEPFEAGAEKNSGVQIDLYCEQMQLALPAS